MENTFVPDKKIVREIPLEDFFKNPEFSSFQLSPNGENIAYLKPWGEGNRMLNVFIRPVGSNKEIRITSATKRSLYGYFWVSNTRIAYAQDDGGNENIHIFVNRVQFNIKLTKITISRTFKILS